MSPLESLKNWVNKMSRQANNYGEGNKQPLSDDDYRFILMAWRLKSKQDNIRRRVQAQKQVDDLNDHIINVINQLNNE